MFRRQCSSSQGRGENLVLKCNNRLKGHLGEQICNMQNCCKAEEIFHLCMSSLHSAVTPSIEQDPKASQIKEGENLTLFCNASGSSLRISWEKNGSDVNSSEDSRILLSRENVQLTIVNVRKTDRGAYQCVASNEVGVATSNAAIVNVQCEYNYGLTSCCEMSIY